MLTSQGPSAGLLDRSRVPSPTSPPKGDKQSLQREYLWAPPGFIETRRPAPEAGLPTEAGTAHLVFPDPQKALSPVSPQRHVSHPVTGHRQRPQQRSRSPGVLLCPENYPVASHSRPRPAPSLVGAGLMSPKACVSQTPGSGPALPQPGLGRAHPCGVSSSPY